MIDNKNMEWKTRVTEMLGCRYPIIQGAYGGFGTSAIAAPVSEAGGFGIITAMSLRTPEGLRQDIRRARSMTNKPFGVNLSIGMCPRIDEMREVCIEEGIPAVETAAYKAAEHGKRLKAAGVKWIHKVATVKHAVAAQEQGADAIVIVGMEGTGFKSAIQLTTLINMTLAARLIKVPLIAAGGIADARGFLGALGMGAEGVYLGTAFMATKECPISDRYKQKLIDASPLHQAVRDQCLAPPKAEEYDKVLKERGSIPQEEWLKRLERVLLKESADTDIQSLKDAGEVLRSTYSLAVGVMDRVVTCKELIDGMVLGAEDVLRTQEPWKSMFRGAQGLR